MKHRDGGFDGRWELECGAELTGLREVDLEKHTQHVTSHQLFLGGLSTTTRFTSLNIFYQKPKVAQRRKVGRTRSMEGLVMRIFKKDISNRWYMDLCGHSLSGMSLHASCPGSVFCTSDHSAPILSLLYA